jgi:hypothetical protein
MSSFFFFLSQLVGTFISYFPSWVFLALSRPDLPLAMAAIAKDSIAELIEIAPTTAIKMLDGLLLTEPAAWMEAEMLGLLGDSGSGALKKKLAGKDEAC